MLIEVIVATALVAGILAVLTQAVTVFTQHNDVIVKRQVAMLAAEAVLNEVRDGHPPTVESFASRFKNMRFEIRRAAGSGRWAGLTHVIVKVSATAWENTPVRVRLDGYVRETAP